MALDQRSGRATVLFKTVALRGGRQAGAPAAENLNQRLGAEAFVLRLIKDESGRWLVAMAQRYRPPR